MQIEILARKENPLLKRVEVTFKAVHKAEPTPNRDALRSELAKALKATKDVVVVDHAASTFGRYETRGYAKVYKSKELATAVERRHILVRNRLAEAVAKPEAVAAAAKPEKPAAAPKKEAPKAEAKPEAKAEKAPAKAEKPAPAKEEKKEERKPAEKAEKPAKAEPKKAEPKKKEGK